MFSVMYIHSYTAAVSIFTNVIFISSLSLQESPHPGVLVLRSVFQVMNVLIISTIMTTVHGIYCLEYPFLKDVGYLN